jgi:hypothetical protein
MPRKKKFNAVEITYDTEATGPGWPAWFKFEPTAVREAEPGLGERVLWATVRGSHPPAEVAALFRRLADLVDRHGTALLVPSDMGWVADDGSMMTELEDGTEVVLSR